MATQRQYATGKRKYATARAWLEPGQGEIKVNGRNLEGYFTLRPHRVQVESPLEKNRPRVPFGPAGTGHSAFVPPRPGSPSALLSDVRLFVKVYRKIEKESRPISTSRSNCPLWAFRAPKPLLPLR